jgi:hypothetical protein
MMVLEWIRRHSPVFDTNIKTYVGAQGPILAVEKAAENGSAGGASSASPSLGIGGLKGVK